MKAFVCAVLLLAATSVNAESMIATDPKGSRYVIWDKPCQLAPDSQWREARWNNKDWVVRGCWTLHVQSNVIVFQFEDGDAAALPFSMFTKHSE